MNKIPASTSQKPQHKVDALSGDPGGLFGVERKRNRTTKFFIAEIDENVKTSQILSFLKQRNVYPKLYISILKVIKDPRSYGR